MRLGLDKRGSLWFLTATTIIFLAVLVVFVPLVGRVWDDWIVDGSSSGGGVFDCLRYELSREFCFDISQYRIESTNRCCKGPGICLASNSPSSLDTRTCLDLKSACDKATVGNHIFSNIEFRHIVRATRDTIYNVATSGIWKAGVGGDSTSTRRNHLHAGKPARTHNNHNHNNDNNGSRGGGTSQFSAAMMAIFTTLPAVSSRQISLVTDNTFRIFSNQSEYLTGSLPMPAAVHMAGCPNPAAILLHQGGSQVSPNSREGSHFRSRYTDMGAGIWKVTSNITTRLQSLIGDRLRLKPSHRNEQSTAKKRKNISPPKASENPNLDDTPTTIATTTHHLTTPKNVFGLPSSPSVSEQPHSGYAHSPVTSGRKELRGSCLGLVVGLVACIIWF